MSGLKLKPRKTVEDYMKLPEGTRAELIDGEIFMSPSPKVRHQNRIAALFLLLSDLFRRRNLGRVFFAPLDVHLPSGDIVQPDLFGVASRNLGIVQDWIRGAPDLVVEVVSPEGAERDRIVKRALYARNLVPEYWIVDEDARAVEVLRLAGNLYEAQGYFEIDDTLRSAAFPDLVLPLRRIFEG